MTKFARIYAIVLLLMFTLASSVLAAWGIFVGQGSRTGCIYTCVGADDIGWVCIRTNCPQETK